MELLNYDIGSNNPMVIKDIIYIMVVALFTVACWLQVESVPRGVRLLPLDLST